MGKSVCWKNERNGNGCVVWEWGVSFGPALGRKKEKLRRKKEEEPANGWPRKRPTRRRRRWAA